MAKKRNVYQGLPPGKITNKSNTVSVDDVIRGLSSAALRKAFKKNNSTKGAVKVVVKPLKVKDLVVDEAYQRMANEREIARIYQNFDPNAFGTIHVSHQDGEYRVTDGQQRVIAARIYGYDTVLCVITKAKDLKGEACIFDKINTGRRAVPAPVRVQNGVIMGIVNDQELVSAIVNAGMELGEKLGPNIVRSPAHLAKIARTYRADTNALWNWPLVTDALIAYGEIWPTHTSVEAKVVGGLAALIFTHKYSHLADAASKALVKPSVLRDRLLDKFGMRMAPPGPGKKPRKQQGPKHFEDEVMVDLAQRMKGRAFRVKTSSGNDFLYAEFLSKHNRVYRKPSLELSHLNKIERYLVDEKLAYSK